MNKTLILLILFIGISISGCISSESYSPIKYMITIETNEPTTLYLPVLLDLPDNTVADLVDYLKIEKKESPDIEVSYDVIDTIHGKALRINTSGNVSLMADSGFKYYNSHSEMPLSPFKAEYENAPKFFNVSMKIYEINTYTSFHWAYLETNNTNQVKVRIYNRANTKMGGESYYSLSDGSDERNHFITIKPGWQPIGFQRKVGYY